MGVNWDFYLTAGGLLSAINRTDVTELLHALRTDRLAADAAGFERRLVFVPGAKACRRFHGNRRGGLGRLPGIWRYYRRGRVRRGKLGNPQSATLDA